MDKQTALAKVRKCLALATSSNPHEAVRALEQARKLMQQHGLSDLDVELAEASEKASKAATVTATNWDTELAITVARAFGCKTIRSTGKRLTADFAIKRVAEWLFVGLGSAPEIAAYAYEVLARQCTKARREHMAQQPKACKPATRTARGDAFAIGWVWGVSRVVEQFAGNAAADARIAAYMAQRWPDAKDLQSKDRTAGRNVKPDSGADGYAMGRQVKLHGAVGGAGEVLRIGGAA
jgi:hypothetical protein